jgi:hypothetical protein
VTVGATNLASIVLGPTGTIRGVFVNRDDGSPISAARVSIGNAAFPSTGVDGSFQASGLALWYLSHRGARSRVGPVGRCLRFAYL